MAWIYLLVAGILEIVWAFSMKKSEGFTLLVPSAVTIMTMIASFGLLAIAMRSLPLGTAYTIWTGIGAVGAFVVGVAILGEAFTIVRVLAALLIVAGIGLSGYHAERVDLRRLFQAPSSRVRNDSATMQENAATRLDAALGDAIRAPSA